jgi:hypothetical protein
MIIVGRPTFARTAPPRPAPAVRSAIVGGGVEVLWTRFDNCLSEAQNNDDNGLPQAVTRGCVTGLSCRELFLYARRFAQMVRAAVVQKVTPFACHTLLAPGGGDEVSGKSVGFVARPRLLPYTPPHTNATAMNHQSRMTTSQPTYALLPSYRCVTCVYV